MISKDCKNCEYLDTENREYPCRLEQPIRCTILKKWYDWQIFKKKRNSMNFDNRRLREIQTEKQAYYNLSDESESIHDMLHYHEKIKTLENE